MYIFILVMDYFYMYFIITYRVVAFLQIVIMRDGLKRNCTTLNTIPKII